MAVKAAHMRASALFCLAHLLTHILSPLVPFNVPELCQLAGATTP